MVISRRVLLGTGAAVAGGAALLGAAQVTHRLDDVAEAVGLDPKPEPDPEDDRLVRRAGIEVGTLLALVEQTAAVHASLALATFETLLREQRDAVGGTTVTIDAEPPSDDPAAAVKELQRAYRDVAGTLEGAALTAFSPDLTRVLASMSVGLVQASRTLGELR